MANKSRFRVHGARKFNGANEATVVIDRNNNLVSVRPWHFHRTYEMRLEDMAEAIIYRCIKAEIIEKKRLKKMKRKGILG